MLILLMVFVFCFLASKILTSNFVNAQGPNGKNYIGDLGRRRYADARTNCASFGGHLPRPRNIDEYNFLESYFTGDKLYLWIDGKSTQDDYRYSYSDGSEFDLNNTLTWYVHGGRCENCECNLQLLKGNQIESRTSSRFFDTICETPHANPMIIGNGNDQKLQFMSPSGIHYATVRIYENFNGGRQLCDAEGGFLPRPQNAEELNFLIGAYGTFSTFLLDAEWNLHTTITSMGTDLCSLSVQTTLHSSL